MLMKMFWKGAKTDEEFKERLIGRRNMFILLLFVGAASLAVGLTVNTEIAGNRGDFLSGLYCGIGTGVILASLVALYRNWKLRKDSVRLHQERLKEADERNRTLNQKSFYLAGVVSFFAQYVIFLAAGFFSMEVMRIMWGLLILYCFSFIIIRKILERRM